MKNAFRKSIRLLLFGLAFRLAATAAYAKPNTGGFACTGGSALGTCVEWGINAHVCCFLFGL